MNVYHFKMLDGKSCCDVDNDEYLCDACRAALAGDTTSPRRRVGAQEPRAAEGRQGEKDQAAFVPPPVPDSWALGIAAMRAAESTESTGKAKELAVRRAAAAGEAAWNATRAAELADQRTRFTAHLEARPSPPRLTTAETASYAPIDPYADAIKKHQEEERLKR